MYFKSITMIGRTVKVTNTTPKRCKNLKHALGFNKKIFNQISKAEFTFKYMKNLILQII